MQIIGLTGGMATGKSTTCALLRKIRPGLPIVDADALSHEATRKGSLPYWLLRHVVLPRDCFDEASGELLRTRLGALMFAPTGRGRALKRAVERCIHPWVIWRMCVAIVWCWLQGHAQIVLDIPLLFECRLTWMCTTTLLIDTQSHALRMERLLARNPELSPRDAENRIAAQMPMERKRRLAQWIIDNDKDVAHLEGELRRLFSSAAFVPNARVHVILYLIVPLVLGVLISGFLSCHPW